MKSTKCPVNKFFPNSKGKLLSILVTVLIMSILLPQSMIVEGESQNSSTDVESTFEDVSTNHWAYSYIERLYNAGITKGCSEKPPLYCPEDTVTRAQMAIFLERGTHGKDYQPPAVEGGTGFGDVPADHWAAAWIKQLAADGITAGCGNGNYCPEQSVTRAQMALFLLRAEHGSEYEPPALVDGSGFNDVGSNYWAAAWIKQLADEGITTGCGNGNYCPESPVTRAQMAVFLVRTFDIQTIEKWHHYRITYSLELDNYLGPIKVWMPLPAEGVTQKNITLLNTSPTPTDIYFEPKGNQIIYWNADIKDSGSLFSEQFEIYILEKKWDINPYRVGNYELDDPVIGKYLEPSSMIQSDHPEIIAAAHEIIGEETNTYLKVLKISNWLYENISPGGQNGDALEVLRTRKWTGCGSMAHIFVALCKAENIPARIVSGAVIKPGIFNWAEVGWGTHIWAEYYLPTYGWISYDYFGRLNAESKEDHLIFSRDSDIDLGYGRGIVPWFHMTHVNDHQEGHDLIIEVEYLGVVDNPGN